MTNRFKLSLPERRVEKVKEESGEDPVAIYTQVNQRRIGTIGRLMGWNKKAITRLIREEQIAFLQELAGRVPHKDLFLG